MNKFFLTLAALWSMTILQLTHANQNQMPVLPYKAKFTVSN